MRASAHPERAGKFLCQSAVLVLRAQCAHQGDAERDLQVAALVSSAHIGKGPGAVLADNIFKLRGNFINGLIPRNPLEVIADFFKGYFKRSALCW